MRKVIRVFFLLTIFCISNKTSFAADKYWSYTMEEMHNMASAYKKYWNNKNINDSETLLMAGQFKGYVAAILDNSFSKEEIIIKCTQKHSVSFIAMRAANKVTQSLNRSANASKVLRFAVLFECDKKSLEEK